MANLKDKVIVITGASSGIGKSTALEFARQGAKVVLAGRDANALRETEREIAATGGTATPMLCDVTQEEQVERLAARAEEAFGPIDVWVNNAGVNLFAKFDEAPTEDYRQVIETDFFGYVYGARAAVKRFKAHGTGTLINVDSIEGIAPKPFNGAYAAAKHAVRALASSLRMELAADGFKDIHVCSVMPASVDTPLFAHSANYTGQSLTTPGSATAPSDVASAIAKLTSHPQREVVIGGARTRGSLVQYLLTPNRYERQTAKWFLRRHLTGESANDARGNLYDPTNPHSIHGGLTSTPSRRAGKLMPWLAIGGAVMAVGGLATWLLWPGQKRPTQLRKLMPHKAAT